MPELTIQQTLLLAKKGNVLIREELIQNHKPFIAKVSSELCKRYLTWGHDEELSIALVAFNEAIDGYKPDQGASFYSFSKTVITRRLIDFFRKESKHQVLSLTPLEADEDNLYDYESASSFKHYKEEEQKSNFAETVKIYTTVVSCYFNYLKLGVFDPQNDRF